MDESISVLHTIFCHFRIHWLSGSSVCSQFHCMPVGVETFPQENELMRWQTRKNYILGTFLRSPKLYHLNCYELR